MGIAIVNLVYQKLLMTKTTLNWFKPVCAQLLDITDSQKDMVTQYYKFLPFFTKLTLNTIWINITTYIYISLSN